MNRLLLLIGLCMCGLPASAQQVWQGTVANGQAAGIPYATVRMLATDSTFIRGTVTDSLGTFRIEAPHDTGCILHVSSVGYRSKYVHVASPVGGPSFSPIVLESDNVWLNEVVVKGQTFVRQKDHLLILPDKKQVRHSATGYDLLYRLMIPEVEVDRVNGKVTAIGGETTLYVDGRKVSSQEVQNLNPKDIEKIEYYDVPTGKYMNDVTAINFVTKKYASGGYVSFNGSQRVGYMNGDYNAVAKLSRTNTDYTLFAGYSTKEYRGLTDETQETFVFTDHVTTRHSSMLENKVKNHQQYIQLNMANKKDKRYLSGKLSLVHNASPGNSSRSALQYDGADRWQGSATRIDQSGWKPGVELYGHFDLSANRYFEMTLAGNYTGNRYTYAYEENNYAILSDNQEDMYEFFAIVNYGIQFKHQNALTLQGYHFHTVSAIDYTGSITSWQHFWEGESMLFVDYTQRFGKKFTLRVSPGFSYIQYRLHHDERKDKLSPRLRFNVMYAVTKHQQVRLACPIGSGFLDISQLNNVEQQIDSLQVRRGNPHQKIPFQTTPSVAYNGQFGAINIGADVSYNVVNYMRSEEFSIESGKLVRSYSSNRKHRVLSTQLFGAWKITDNLRVRLNGGWQYIHCPFTAEKLKSVWGNMQADYYWKDFACGIYAKSKTRWLNFNLMRITLPAQCGGYLSWNPKNWRIEAGVVNPFSKGARQESVMNREIYSYQNKVATQLDRPSGYFKLAYTFDFGKKTTREDSRVDKSMNSAIMKVD